MQSWNQLPDLIDVPSSFTTRNFSISSNMLTGSIPSTVVCKFGVASFQANCFSNVAPQNNDTACPPLLDPVVACTPTPSPSPSHTASSVVLTDRASSSELSTGYALIAGILPAAFILAVAAVVVAVVRQRSLRRIRSSDAVGFDKYGVRTGGGGGGSGGGGGTGVVLGPNDPGYTYLQGVAVNPALELPDVMPSAGFGRSLLYMPADRVIDEESEAAPADPRSTDKLLAAGSAMNTMNALRIVVRVVFFVAGCEEQGERVSVG